ncbi:MAG TPA: FkbM family methyltransferase [Marmoricola sp.]|nr:FkbM family methyltransferase [Marmoricola sp.]
MPALSHNARETAKLGLRRFLYHFDLDLTRHPFVGQVARTAQAAGLNTVLDVGANVGQYATLLRSGGFNGHIFSVEPLDDAYEILQKRAIKDGRWTVINAAVGAEPGTLTIHKASNSYSSSLLPITARHTDVAPDSVTIGEQEVEVRTVAELIATYNVDPTRTLLKVDTQGYEMPVLDGAGSHLTDFAALQLEMSFVELYAGQVLFDELHDKLRDLGFRIWAFEPGISDQDGRMLQCDTLFLGSASQK